MESAGAPAAAAPAAVEDTTHGTPTGKGGSSSATPRSEQGARRSARKPVPKAIHEARLDDTTRRSAGKRDVDGKGIGFGRGQHKDGASAPSQGAEADEASQPPRKRGRQLFPSGPDPDADHAGGAEAGSHSHAGPPNGGSGNAQAPDTPTGRKRSQPSGGPSRVAGGATPKRLHQSPRKSHALEDDDLLKAKGRGKKGAGGSAAGSTARGGDLHAAGGSAGLGARAGGQCNHLMPGPGGAIYAKAMHLLYARPRRFCMYEWFYSAVDVSFFKPLESEFQACLAECGLPHLTRLARPEWAFLRSLLGRTRRLSKSFLHAERARLKEHRQLVREQGRARLSVGQRVVAFHPTVRQLHMGQILTPDGYNYRVQFDRQELGVQLVLDYQVAAIDESAGANPHRGAAGAGGGALAMQDTTDTDSLAAAAVAADHNASPMSPHLQISSEDLAVISALRRLVDRKRVLLAEVEQVNDEVDKGVIVLSGLRDKVGSDQRVPSCSYARRPRLFAALTPPRFPPSAAVHHAQAPACAAVRQHMKWLLDQLQATNSEIERLVVHLGAIKAHHSSGSGTQRLHSPSLDALLHVAQQGAEGARSVLRDALITTRALDRAKMVAAKDSPGNNHSWPTAPSSALGPAVQELVGSALDLLLRVQGMAAAGLGQDEVMLLVETSLARLRPQVRAASCAKAPARRAHPGCARPFPGLVKP